MQTERVRDSNTFRTSTPLRRPQSSPTRPRPLENSHNIGTRHPARQNPTFSSTVLPSGSNSARIVAATDARRELESGNSSHYGHSKRLIPTFESSNLLYGRASPVKAPVQRSEKAHVQVRLAVDILRAWGAGGGVFWRPSLGRATRSNNLVLVVQPSWEKGEHVGTHEHGKGRRNVPTFNSSGIERANFGHVRPPLPQLRACARL
jgi:hypothetical protein